MIVLITVCSLITFILLTEILTVNIVLADEKTLEFNLMIFAFSIKFGGERDSKEKKKRRKPNIAALRKFIFSVAEVSEIRIKRLSIPIPDVSPGGEALAKGFLFSVLSVLVGFAKENTGFFSLSSINFNQLTHTNLKLEASVKISLLRFLIRLVPFLLNFSSASGKNTEGRLKNGRKQNERAD